MRRISGLTLLELVLVVAILAAVAAAAVGALEAVDVQSRYDDAKLRAQAIKDAICGRPDRSVNGQPDLAGFVADMGRLPNNVAELVTSTLSGWHGPYVRGARENVGAELGRLYPDGWRPPADPLDPNCGWSFATNAGVTEIRSSGEDGVFQTTDDQWVTIQPWEWQVSLEAGWTLWLDVRSASGFTGDLSVSLTTSQGSRQVTATVTCPLGRVSTLVPFTLSGTAGEFMPIGARPLALAPSGPSPSWTQPFSILFVPRASLPHSSSATALVVWVP